MVAFVFVLFLPFYFFVSKIFLFFSIFILLILYVYSSSSSYYVPESQDVVFIETTICLKCLANWILIMLQCYNVFYFVIE